MFRLYPQTTDMCYVARKLGYKNVITRYSASSLKKQYSEAKQAAFQKVAKAEKEICSLIKAFERLTELEGVKIFRKRKL